MKKLRITVDGKTYDVEVEILGSKIASVAPAAAPVVSAPAAAPAAPAPQAAPAPAAAGANDIACPLAAVVVAVNVKEGQKVKAGDLLVTLEAMNTPVNSPADGTVSRICVNAGQSVNEGEVLLSLS